MRSISGFVISLVSVLGINFIPLEMWLYGDFSGQSAMIFYALETILAVTMSAAFVFLLAPREEPNPDFGRTDRDDVRKSAFPNKKIRRKSDILQVYLVFSFGFSISATVIMTAFIFLVLKAPIQPDTIINALMWIVGFQVFELVGGVLMLRPLTLAESEALLKRSMGKVAVLFLSVFLGFFLAGAVNEWFVVPFIGLKTLVDITEQLGNFRGLGKPRSPVEPSL
jgi:hypothetical protein